jgi:hypothetical protein
LNAKIGTEAAQFPGKECKNGIFLSVQRAVKNHLASDAVGPVAERTLEDVHIVL